MKESEAGRRSVYMGGAGEKKWNEENDVIIF